MTLDDIEKLPVKIEYVGITRAPWGDDKPSDVDLWRVTLSDKNGAYSIDYHTGLGCRSPAERKPKKPKIADVLNCLLLDSSALDENFSDWCAEFGYSDDSIKALNTYKTCIDNGRALNKYLGRDVVKQLSRRSPKRCNTRQ